MLSVSENNLIRKFVFEYIDRDETKITTLAKNNFENEIMRALGSINLRGESSLSFNHFSSISYMLIGKAVADLDPELLLNVGRHSGLKT